jgi:hypothetical protein
MMNESRSRGFYSHDTGWLTFSFHTEPQVFPNQAEACQGPEAEPPCASVDSPPNWQHHPVRLIPLRDDDFTTLPVRPRAENP